MQTRWSDQAAQDAIKKYEAHGEDIALRVYTSQLIGAEDTLVLHGGGNTSVKTTVRNKLGEETEVLAVKGSGWDLKTIEPQGFPCVDLEHCRKLRQLPSLSDEDMVNELRTHMLDFRSPNPSVEALLHAFLPHKFIDHSHADTILSLVDQEDAAGICKEIFGDSLAIVDYIMPGFALSQKAAEVYEANPHVKGLLLLKHGLFTFGDTAKESYERHIEAVTLAENYIQKAQRRPLTIEHPQPLDEHVTAHLYPTLRSLYHELTGKPWVLHSRINEATRAFASSTEAISWSQIGPITPDHVIRTKPTPCLLRDIPREPEAMRMHLRNELRAYAERYHAYFTRQQSRAGTAKTELDRLPRVFLIEGLGLVTAAPQEKAASIAADVYEHTIEAIQDAMAVGHYQPVSEADIFDMEYWSLEQAKLGKSSAPALQGQVAYVTGAASGIGFACAKVFAKAGAHLYLIDIQAEKLQEAAQQLRKSGASVAWQLVDVTDAAAVRSSFEHCVRQYGGVDIVISNAGAAFQAPMIECEDELLEKSFALNFFSHQYIAQAACKVMQQQRYGGSLLFNVSKAALNPGPQFGPYATAKAAAMALMKQYALEGAPHRIRANAVNADRIRTGLFTDEFVQQRAAARGLEPEAYFRANLLGVEVYAEDVAQAFLHLALAEKTTATILTVDGGNIAASPR
ncbi:MAG: bifunctional aldolase/short-chain dehydrogenase [Myxococcales bacterium]|nr:bifunctional aldolase/short-chain dehydrogenase [Myxococcales bacterium]